MALAQAVFAVSHERIEVESTGQVPILERRASHLRPGSLPGVSHTFLCLAGKKKRHGIRVRVSNSPIVSLRFSRLCLCLT